MKETGTSQNKFCNIYPSKDVILVNNSYVGPYEFSYIQGTVKSTIWKNLLVLTNTSV